MAGSQITKKREKTVWLWLLLSAVVVAIDQLTKMMAISALKDKSPFYAFPNVLRFVYVENKGAAFGSLSDQRWIFMIFSTVAILALTVYLMRYSEKSILLRMALALVIGGGIGNMIDRIAYGYVVDFIDFCAFPKIWSWVFNVADSAVVIGAGLLILYCLITFSKERKREQKAAMKDDTEEESHS